MKCEQAQKLLMRRDLGGAAASIDEAVAHVQNCRECADFVAFDKQLEATLELRLQASQETRSRLHRTIAEASGANSWIRLDRRSTLMKRITLSAALTALVTACMIVVSTKQAAAADAKAEFLNIRHAVLAFNSADEHLFAPAQSEYRVVEGQTGERLWISTAQGPVMIVGGQSSPTSPANPPNSDAAAQLRRAQQGAESVRELEPMRIDLDAANYRSIVFGTKANTLVLTPKAESSRRYVLAYDPKSNLPKSVVLEHDANGKWQFVRQLAIPLSRKA